MSVPSAGRAAPPPAVTPPARPALRQPGKMETAEEGTALAPPPPPARERRLCRGSPGGWGVRRRRRRRVSLGSLGGPGAVHARRGSRYRGCRCPGPASPPAVPGPSCRGDRAGPRGAAREAARAGAPYITTGNGERGGERGAVPAALGAGLGWAVPGHLSTGARRNPPLAAALPGEVRARGRNESSGRKAAARVRTLGQREARRGGHCPQLAPGRRTLSDPAAQGGLDFRVWLNSNSRCFRKADFVTCAGQSV